MPGSCPVRSALLARHHEGDCNERQWGDRIFRYLAVVRGRVLQHVRRTKI